MSVFSGRQYPGAMRDHRERKRAEAQERDQTLAPDSMRRSPASRRARGAA